MKAFTVTIPGFTIAGKAWGNPELPPMLALHGWFDNANSFDLLAPYLEKHFYLLAVDLPGHGLSSHLPQGCYYHFSDGIFTTLQIIQALGFKQIHLLGHSMGACLTSLIAGVIPEQVLSLVLIEGLGPFSQPEHTCRTQLTQYAHHLFTENKEAKPYKSLSLATQARAKRGYLSLEHAQIICQRGVVKKKESFYWRHDRRLLSPTPLRMTEGQILSCLHGITAKSCLILANDGFVFKDFDMQERVEAVKDLQIHRINGGHHIHMEQPDVIAQRLVEFYKIT